MEFVTIQQLSRELNVPARVIRYRLILLIAEGKLKENEDFRRDDFKGDQYFVWKINPLSFMQLTNLKPDIPVTKVPVPLVTLGIKLDNQPLPTVNEPGINLHKLGEEVATTVTHVDNNYGQRVNGGGKVDNESGTKEPSLERELIDLLKEQIKIKDGQLRDQGEQLDEVDPKNWTTS